MPTEERELHNNGLSEDTSTVLRDGGIDGNEIRKNSRNIGKFAETRVHIVVSLINKEMLLQCHKELDGNKAVGVDEITKKEYERNLEQNIDDLVERLKEIIQTTAIN